MTKPTPPNNGGTTTLPPSRQAAVAGALPSGSPPAPKGRLTTGPVLDHLKTMTIPMIWALLSMMLFNVADTFFVGQLGTDQLAAMSFTFPVIMVFFSIGIGLGAGASSAVARAIGEGDQAKVRRLATNGILLTLVIVIIGCAVGIFTIDPLFRALGATEAQLPYIRDYMTIWYLGFGLLILPMVGNGAIRASGDSKFPSIIMMVAAAVNIILDPILIFGLWGFPRLELEGAAIATVCARGMTLVASVAVLHFRERMLTRHIGTQSEIWQAWKTVLHIGLPASFTNMINPAALGVVTALIAVHGPEAVAAFGVGTRIEALGMVALFAMSAVVGPIAGQNWGAGQIERVHELVQLMIVFSIVYGLGVAAVYAVAGPVIAPWFADNPAVYEITTLYLWIVPISLMGHGILINVCALFNGIGKPVSSIVLTVIRMGVLYLPLAALLSPLYGPVGIFSAALIANLGVGVTAAVWVNLRMRQVQIPQVS
ncbi:MAG: MATE family efflux transporter [Alphaproteobacteria bacterium]